MKIDTRWIWTWLVLSLLAISLSSSTALANGTFTARVTLDLCPEYPFGGVSVVVKYTVGNSSDAVRPTVLFQEVNTEDNTAVFDIELPTTLGTTDLNVFAQCTNSFGEGEPSNSVAVSNCDVLALRDSDLDGLADNLEDVNCSNFFDPADSSNPFNWDSDGDRIYDGAEVWYGTDPTDPGSSPRRFVFSGGAFDPDGDGNANSVAWRPSNGYWFIRDFTAPGNHLALQYGDYGDTPFVYSPANSTSNVGVIRRDGINLLWLFNGPGFQRSDSSSENLITFGMFGDNIILGPWESPDITNPAVMRLFNNAWFFVIYLSDGTTRVQAWGGSGDLPKVSDYDGDGLFDIAVYRPTEQKTFVIQSNDGVVKTYQFGTGTADHSARGDADGDGIDDLIFWEPINAVYSTLTSENGFDDELGREMDPDHYHELQLGLYFIHLPISFNRQGDKDLFTVVDHATGWRAFRAENDPLAPVEYIQWGLPGDALG